MAEAPELFVGTVYNLFHDEFATDDEFFARVDRDMAAIKEANITHVLIFPMSEWDESTRQLDFHRTDYLVRRIEQLGLKFVPLMLKEEQNSHYFPIWKLRQMPELWQRHTGQGNATNTRENVDFADPRVLPAVRDYFKAVAGRYADSPALAFYNVWNEPHYSSGAPHVVERYQAWLSAKYGTLSNLNRAWGEDYDQWDQVTPFVNDDWDSSMPGIDWAMFRNELNGILLGELSSILREYDADAIVNANPVNTPFVDFGRFESYSTDQWAYTQYADFGGASYYPDGWDRANSPKIQPAWRHNLAFNVFRNASAPKGYILTELYTNAKSGLTIGGYLDAQNASHLAWLAIANECKGLIYWKWLPFMRGRQSLGRGLCRLDGTLAPRGQAVKDVADVVAANRKLLDAGRMLPSQAAIVVDMVGLQKGLLQNIDSRTQSFMYESIAGVFRALDEQGITVDILRADLGIDARQLAQYKVVYLPFQIVVRRDTAQLLRDYVEAGGTVVADARTATSDELDYAYSANPGGGLGELFGARRIDWVADAGPNQLSIDWPGVYKGLLDARFFREEIKKDGDTEVHGRFTETGLPALLCKRQGKGEAVLLGFSLGATAFHGEEGNPASSLVAAIARRAGVIPAAVFEGNAASAPTLRVHRSGDALIVYVINNADSVLEGTVRVARSDMNNVTAVELTGGSLVEHEETDADIRIPVSLDRLGASVFVLSNRPLATSAYSPELEALSPADGAIVRNNAPALAWRPVQADLLELWIDGIKLETLPGDTSSWVPFPLSFGRHTWQLVAVRDGLRIGGKKNSFTVEDRPLAELPDGALLLRDNWRMQSSEICEQGGDTLSLPDADTRGWYPATVPSTVLGTLVRNGVYPNPYVSLNNMCIPDASDAYNEQYDLAHFSHIPGHNPWAKPYWFRTTVQVPGAYAGKKLWLTFNEINYRADVWVNGVHVGKADEVAGMERSFRFDLSACVKAGEEACIAVAIHPLDVPAEPAPEPEGPLGHPGENMGRDGQISLNYTKWDTSGWDWQPAVRDRDMGIVEDVYLSASENIELQDPYVAAELEMPTMKRADVYVEYELVNHGDEPVEGCVSLFVRDNSGSLVASGQLPYRLASKEVRSVQAGPDTLPSLRLHEPQLWWPADMGEQNLYSLELQAWNEGHLVAKTSGSFGVRKFESRMGPTSRIFTINGRDIYVRGGNWVIDMMLTWNAVRYEKEILQARQSGLNFLRVWGPTGAPPTAFYEAADKYGILVQQDFLNDFWGMQRNSPHLVPPEELARAASIQIVKRYRNHPSLVIWCGGNEGVNQREAAITGEILPRYDPHGSRFYLKASDGDGLKGGGPYHNMPARDYFGHDKITGFNSEIGPSGVPEFESLRRFLEIKTDGWADGRFPLDWQWAYHDAVDRAEDDRKYSHYDNILRHNYGQVEGRGVEGLREYAMKAQLVNYDTYRAAMEALNKQLWKGVTGFSIWKFNSSWPSLVWQTSDWYMQSNAGFYALRMATRPLHIQINRDDNTLSVINRSELPLENARVELEVFDVDMQCLGESDMPVNVPAAGTFQTAACEFGDGFRFVRLRLFNASGEVLARNVYWLEPEDDYTAMNKVPDASLAVQATAARTGDSVTVTLSIRNEGSQMAMLLRQKLIDATTGLEVLPTLWNDNYSFILPGEQMFFSAIVSAQDMPELPELELGGYNYPVQRFEITTGHL